ncbi:undecaprenyldiphospho-muramoylpentapeptide beta-N-acetylglucosaminyltransferase [Peptoniphilus sp. oral taxon 386]|uniref:undecaprenyldiphospho-muramoylpentapeptide beta-N-acetylglucosaminyltransferase n=1 Tax=Peptoniphilus sp. oral taxon 386 TaxID=652713 RepID=UPI0001DA9BF8|nr:undecaprenyldiphospho-muramoylpentapeptide beta-N-acetylglucosaminyltransferase [Peptoniphilus sp. oral taxon 386]EFI42181.1 undecaprenyldiphospho-muramoylpentapeptide beta-N-acetylglucosaminyltransferase [Peptoniphilus sp. oral taxon 386 str. F0131]
MKYILSGGGTGGHIYPALAIANELRKRNRDNEILYVGKEGSLEEELVKTYGIDFEPIHIEGLPRKKINKQTFITMLTLFKGLRECNKIIKKFKPDVVIGTGGYVCAPIVLKAQQKKIKTVIQEQNAYPGKTNRLLAKKANLVSLNFEEAREYLNTDNIIITGNPVRDDFENIDRENARRELGILDSEKFVLSFGGSGGQESTNEAVIDIIKSKKDINFKFMHITGKTHYNKFMENLNKNNISENITILNYSYEIPKLLMASDLVIASSSAMTLAEVSAVGIASILIPKAYTAGNHQVFNAKSYENKGASKVILEENLNGDILYNNIVELISNDNLRNGMALNSKKIGNIEAVKLLVDKIESLK